MAEIDFLDRTYFDAVVARFERVTKTQLDKRQRDFAYGLLDVSFKPQTMNQLRRWYAENETANESTT